MSLIDEIIDGKLEHGNEKVTEMSADKRNKLDRMYHEISESELFGFILEYCFEDPNGIGEMAADEFFLRISGKIDGKKYYYIRLADFIYENKTSLFKQFKQSNEESFNFNDNIIEGSIYKMINGLYNQGAGYEPYLIEFINEEPTEVNLYEGFSLLKDLLIMGISNNDSTKEKALGSLINKTTKNLKVTRVR
jgi:hypothetical protein